MKKLLFLLLAISFLASCSDSRVIYSEYRELPDERWHQDSVLTYTFMITDTTSLYSIHCMVRHTDMYNYQNLWLFMDVPGDTLQIMLADNRGKWKTRRAGRFYDGYTVWVDSCRFSHPGEYTYQVRQGMRDSLLTGISSLGLRVQRRE